MPLGSIWNTRVSVMEVRASGDPTTIADAVRRTMQSSAPDMPSARVQLLSTILAPLLRPWRMGASMFSAFGVLALGLAAIGLYGVLSYMVAQRTREIGIRKALGAQDGSVVRMVVGSALGVTVAGILAGALVAIPGGRLIASQLYGVSSRDPLVFGACAAVLTAVALLASCLPAKRAARVDPMVALRSG